MGLKLFFYQTIGGMNDGLQESSSRFMEIIHGIQNFQQLLTQSWHNFWQFMNKGIVDFQQGIDFISNLI